MVQLSRREPSGTGKLLLVKLIGLLIANVGVAELVVEIIKTICYAGLRTG